MAKLLLVAAVFTVVYLILRSYGRKMDRRMPPQEGATRGADSGHGEDMVRCRVCGVHLPKSEAITSRGEMFCSREHLQLSRNGS
ncbi:MAG TPA: PP0621 family protein [Burkholderiales bacterium]|nr:PP0621 family protein [Burkholderiales bacterium]